MNLVSESEFELLSIARALFDRSDARPASPVSPLSDDGSLPLGLVANLLRQSRKLPEGMSPAALRILGDTMAKGIIWALARRGGYCLGESLSMSMTGAAVRRGRLWERHEPQAFHLSPFAVHLCRWLTQEPQRSAQCLPLTERPVTLGDELLLYLALDLTVRARCAQALAGQPAARASALCWLGFVDVLALAGDTAITPADISIYAFASLAEGAGAVVLEALGPDLRRRWVQMERDKRRLGVPAQITAVGRIQTEVLTTYFDAIASARRRDLAQFAMLAVADLVDERPAPEDWMPTLLPGGSLRERNEARRAMLALVRSLGVVKRWSEEASAVRFFDDDYESAQLLLRMWEGLGESRYQRAFQIAAELSRIDTLAAD